MDSRPATILAWRIEVRHLVATMVFAELKPQIELLSHDEKVKAMAFLKHLLRSENPAYQRELAQRHRDIELSGGLSLSDARKRLENG